MTKRDPNRRHNPFVQTVEQAVEQAFGLLAATIESIGIGQGQTARYKISTTDRQFIGKHLGPSSTGGTANVLFECALLDRLARGGMPVAEVFETLDGRPFAMVDDRPFLLCEWMQGCIEWPTSPQNAKLLGRALAEMHAVSDELPFDGQVRAYDLDRLVDRPLRLISPFAGSRRQFEALERAVAPLRERIAAVPKETGTFGPIHGDIHQGNCVFNDNGGLSVFDFALCGVGYRAYDLTGYLWPMRDDTINDPDMRECCAGFLDGYRSVRSLTAQEEAAIPGFVQIRTLWETGDWIDTGTGRDQPDDVRTAISHMIDQFRAS